MSSERYLKEKLRKIEALFARAGTPGEKAAARRLEALEIALCRSPGLIDSGNHLIAAARKP